MPGCGHYPVGMARAEMLDAARDPGHEDKVLKFLPGKLGLFRHWALTIQGLTSFPTHTS
jgi:hypothetical protein